MVSTASSWAASNGILMGARDPETLQPLKSGSHIYEPAPFSLYPTPFPRDAFEMAYKMARPFNAVVHRAANNYSGWLKESIQTAAAGDKEFTGKMVELANEVEAAGRVQHVTLGILRSDYMLHCPSTNNVSPSDSQSLPESFHKAKPLQVELNTIASSFGCLSTKVTKMHKHLNSIITSGSTCRPLTKTETPMTPFHDFDNYELPENNAADGIAQALSLAYLEYKRQRKEMLQSSDENLQNQDMEHVIVMVVQPGETNSCDQRDLEFILQKSHGIRVIRRTLLQLANTSNYAGNESIYKGRELMINDFNGQVAAAVVYYRAGYTPDDYPSNTEWEGRQIVEHSGAIKCPDIFYHVFGAKKIQQALAVPGNLRQFCSSDEEERLLSSTFAGLYALGEGDDSEAINTALGDPKGYVLKPQREGGGNNLYDEQLVHALTSMSFEERRAYILMQKIMPPSAPGKLVRGGKVVHEGECVCELGVFGITLRRYGDLNEADSILMDTVVGHILRVKSVQTDEGGVAAGYAFLSSPMLI